MLTKILEIWKRWSDEGIRLPYLFDPSTSQPSITLGMLYIASLIMFGSIVTLHFKDGILTASLTTIMVWILAYVFYRLRKLDKVKIDLDDQSLELEDNSSEEKEKK